MNMTNKMTDDNMAINETTPSVPSVVNDVMTQHLEDATPNVMPVKLNTTNFGSGDIKHDMNQNLSREAIIYHADEVPAATAISFFTGGPANNLVFRIKPVQSLLNQRFIKSRTSFYRYIRFDSMKIKLKWNTNITVNGLYWLHYSLSPGLDPSNQGFSCISGFPGTLVDINADTSVELEIPWVFPQNQILLDAAGGVPEHFVISLELYAVFPANFPTGERLDFTVYAQFNNPVLSGPTWSNSLVVQQIGSEVAKQAETGIITSTAGTVKDIADKLSMIPGIAEVAAPVSAVAGFVGSIASMFGWSKPRSNETTRRVVDDPFHGMGIPTSDDLSEALTFLRDPAIMPVGGPDSTDLDEMGITYIGEKQVGWAAFTFPATANAEDTLFKIDLPRRYSDPTRPLTPGEFAVENFEYYKFDYVVMELIFAKTPLHNGVLEVGFDYASPSLTSPDDTQTLVYTAPLDIVNTKRMQFKVPYIFETEWMKKTDTMGYFYVKVVDPLSWSGTVSDNVPVLVCKHFEGLVTSGWSPAAYVLGNRTIINNDPDSGTFGANHRNVVRKNMPVQQINVGTTDDLVTVTWGSPNVADHHLVANTTADVAVSLRPVTRIAAPFFKQTVPTIGLLQDDRTTLHRPPYYLTSDVIFPQPLRALSALYFFNRGGMRYKIMTDGSYSLVHKGSNATRLSNYQMVNNNVRFVNELELPQGATGTHYYNFQGPAYLTQKEATGFSIIAEPDDVVGLWQSGADDFTFKGLHGFPAVNIEEIELPVYRNLMKPVLPATT